MTDKYKRQQAIRRLVDRFGGNAALARYLTETCGHKTSTGTVGNWIARGNISPMGTLVLYRDKRGLAARSGIKPEEVCAQLRGVV